MLSRVFPPIDDLDEARKSSRIGLWAALVCGGLTLAVVLSVMVGVPTFRRAGFSAWSLIDAAVYLGLAWGVYKLSRAAAVTALLVFTLNQAALLYDKGPQLWVAPLFFWMFVTGVRGTFRYHRLSVLAQKGAGEPGTSTPPN